MGGIFSRFLNCANDIIKHHIYVEKKKKKNWPTAKQKFWEYLRTFVDRNYAYISMRIKSDKDDIFCEYSEN